MPNLKIRRFNLYDDLFENQNIPECISKIGYKNNNYLLYKSEKLFNKAEALREKKIYSIQIVPEYLDITYHSNLCKTVINEFRLGYASKLYGFKDVKSYVRDQYKKNAKPIFKNIRRLEKCFDVKYVFFYGNIERNNYDFLMESLHDMLTKRFKQRNDSNYRLKAWEDLHSTAFDLINLKKASIFVIYNNNEPIQINIQYHFKDILIASVASYNIDYQMFGLGNTAVYKQIEWCIENDYSIYDQGHGDLAYKRRWSNLVYNFDHHVVYFKSNLKSTLIINIEIIKIKVKGYLRYKKVLDSIKKIKKHFLKDSKNIEKKYEIIKIENFKDEINMFSQINWKSLEYKFLIIYICNFLYYNFEHYNNVEVFQNNSESNKFIIRGENNSQKIIFQ